MNLKDLAAAKKIPLDHLQHLKLFDVPGGGVGIPYWDSNTEPLYERKRGVPGRPRFDQPPGVPLRAYGLWLLSDFRGRATRSLSLVEGESDCWALWLHGYPALGIPGSNALATLTDECVRGFERVELFREPGLSGQTFIAGMCRRLRELNFRGQVLEVTLADVKDPCDLHAKHANKRSAFEAAWNAALAQARLVDLGSQENGRVNVNGDLHLERIIRLGSEIEPQEVEYLWPGVIPLSLLTTFAGQTSQGKTFVACDIMARITNGDRWPDGSQGWVGKEKALLITGDDDADNTLVPRLIEAGADMDKVVFLTEKAQAEWNMHALKTLDIALEQAGGDVRLVIIDPPTSFLADIDDHKNAQLRAVLTSFKDWAKRQRVAVILITHVNKGGANKVEAMARVMGSVAWCTGVRTAYMFAADPNDDSRFLFCCLKNNLGPKAPTQAYRIIQGEKVGRVEWLGEVDTTADEALASKGKNRKVVASEWLIGKFAQKLEWQSDDLFRAAREEGVSRSAIFEARRVLNLPKARKVTNLDGEACWFWWVPCDWEKFHDVQVFQMTPTNETLEPLEPLGK